MWSISLCFLTHLFNLCKHFCSPVYEMCVININKFDLTSANWGLFLFVSATKRDSFYYT